MSKVEIYIVVEGQTEQTFVREILAPYMGQSGIYLHPSLIGKPGHNRYNNPEEINDDPAKAPSKQLETLFYNYRKIALGTEISNAVGIPNIRAKCPHFSNWLTKLEMLRSKNHN